ncbi:MAG TPA: GPW/gp25 family protein [Chloroflexia bacterium]|nr:GPW/gp25 family protein [Chloroflexia bacterium]
MTDTRVTAASTSKRAHRYRAWLFLHPDIDATDEFAGLQLSPRGGIAMVEDHHSVRQAIFLLISTIPGERVMRPDYGCLIYRLIFSPNDDTTAGLAIFYVRRAIEQWEPRVELLRVDAGRNPDAPERLDVILQYRVRATQRTEEARISFNLAGGEV